MIDLKCSKDIIHVKCKKVRSWAIFLWNSKNSVWGAEIGLRVIFISSLKIKIDVLAFCDIQVGCIYPIPRT